jgi:D-hexose-6-phosphate mutarotase
MDEITNLNQRFAIHGHLSFATGEGGLVMANIQNAHAHAQIMLQGAHILTFQPADDAPLIWLSPKAKYIPGKAVRGGVPICWPWFGNYESGNPETDKNYPAHGIARTALWEVIDSEKTATGATRITFNLQIDAAAKALWPHPCALHYIVTVGRDLVIELVTHNTGSNSFTITEALHTYFVIGDIDAVQVSGLEGCNYIDKVDGFKLKTEPDNVKVESEVDRVYLNTAKDCVIEDRKLRRNILVAKSGSDSTVVWNPWSEKSAQMADMGEGAYRGMLCVESANAAENAVTVAPGQHHSMRVVYAVQRG